jgi:hypothetical protein
MSATVLPFVRRAVKTEPYLTDQERAALRRLIVLLPRLEEMDRQLRRVHAGCPTFRREAGE